MVSVSPTCPAPFQDLGVDSEPKVSLLLDPFIWPGDRRQKPRRWWGTASRGGRAGRQLQGEVTRSGGSPRPFLRWAVGLHRAHPPGHRAPEVREGNGAPLPGPGSSFTSWVSGLLFCSRCPGGSVYI